MKANNAQHFQTSKMNRVQENKQVKACHPRMPSGLNESFYNEAELIHDY